MTDGFRSADRDRSAVYAAEDQWSAALDRGGRVDFFGSAIDLPVQLRFGSLEAIATYVGHCADRCGVQAPLVRERRGQRQAHYADGVIAIPIESGWACRESVVLHEFAHHVAGAEERHGVRFRAVMLDLVESRLGASAALLLRAGYEAQGLVVVTHVD